MRSYHINDLVHRKPLVDWIADNQIEYKIISITPIGNLVYEITYYREMNKNPIVVGGIRLTNKTTIKTKTPLPEYAFIRQYGS